jgi:YD repeat-containing protein
MSELPNITAGLLTKMQDLRNGARMPDPRELLVCVLDYIKEQAKEINPRGYRLTPTKGFVRQRRDLAGLAGVEFDIRVEGDHVWLRVPRLTADPAPKPPEMHKTLLRISPEPDGPSPVLDEAALARELNQVIELRKADIPTSEELGRLEADRRATAAIRNNTRAVELLLERGWPSNATLDNGQTALHYAAWHGNYAYNDPLDRITQMVQPTGAQTNISYQSPVWTIVYQDQKTPGDKALQSQVVYDNPGCPIEQRMLEGGSTTTLIAVDTAYDALGRAKWTSNPSRINIPNWSGDGLAHLTLYSYDSLGRITSVQTLDGVQTMTSYSGNSSGRLTTVTDPAGHVRQMTTDALGRLMAVVEDSTGTKLKTQYACDPLGNLRE